jgi:hypothetical protein
MSVLYFAPGAGLGHLNRALAICLQLRLAGIHATIVTNSPFAPGVARLARFPILGIPTSAWSQAVPACLERHQPRLVVTDTFPCGLRGEWRFPPAVPLVYIARRLKLPPYRDALGSLPPRLPVARVIAIEPLAPDHEELLAHLPILRLSGPIRLKPHSLPVPLPPALDRLLQAPHPWLVIHGGVPAEVESLVHHARALMPPTATLAIISPWGSAIDYYPATNIIDRAAAVVSAAGYNIMADMSARAVPHFPVPFPRTFDDQHARLRYPFGAGDGAAEAARAIAALLAG